MQKTIMIFLVLFLLILTSACGVQNKESASQGSIDSRAEKYVETFVSYGTKLGSSLDTYSLTVSFSESMPQSTNGGQVIGYCQRYSNGQKTVVLKESYWNSASVSDREQLIFHELGHCLLGLTHNDTVESAPLWSNTNYQANNVPSSIMNTFHFGSTLYSGNRNEYMTRLFTGHASSLLYWNAPSQIDSTEYSILK